MLAHMRGETYTDRTVAYVEPPLRRQNSSPQEEEQTMTTQEMIYFLKAYEEQQSANVTATTNIDVNVSPPPAQNTAPPVKTGPSKNSDNIAQSVSSLITQQLKEQESKSKKPKEGKTDEERLRNLKPKALKTIDQFIVSSVTSVGSVPEETADEVIIFSRGNSRPPRQDFSLFCFVDNKCVGVGSSAKGIFTSLPKDQFESGFHTLSLGIYNADSYVELFNSQVDFSIKNTFIFDWSGRSIKLAN